MADPPRHVVEEAGVEGVAGVGAAAPDSIFSLVAADGATSVGSTFLGEEPDPVAWVPPLRRRAERFVPALTGARVEGARACARPVSLDGRPLVGPAGRRRRPLGGRRPRTVGDLGRAGYGPPGRRRAARPRRRARGARGRPLLSDSLRRDQEER